MKIKSSGKKNRGTHRVRQRLFSALTFLFLPPLCYRPPCRFMLINRFFALAWFGLLLCCAVPPAASAAAPFPVHKEICVRAAIVIGALELLLLLQLDSADRVLKPARSYCCFFFFFPETYNGKFIIAATTAELERWWPKTICLFS